MGKEWREEHSLKLIELYKKYRNLWDPTDPDYKVVSKRADSWNEIAEIMKTDVNELKKKMATLTSTYRRTHQKVKTTRPDEEYVPTWFAYKHLDFLSARYLDKYTTEEQTSEHEEEKEPPNSSDDSSRSSDQSDDSASQDSLKDRSADDSTAETSRKRKSDYETSDKHTKLTREKDEFDVYGEYIAHVLRNLDSYSMHCVQKVFSDVIFHARTGRYANAAKDETHNDPDADAQSQDNLQPNTSNTNNSTRDESDAGEN